MDNIFDTSKLVFEGDFDTQLSVILKHIRMTAAKIEQLQLLFDELMQIFSHNWRGCTLSLFGSIVTGLALKTSDVDILVSLPLWLDQPRADFVIAARNILRARRDTFNRVTAITKAKVPIVQFYHRLTKVHCDVSFSGPNAVINTAWLEYLIESDDRILPFMIIVKYWSKVHNFTGTNLMSNYCLNLLLIFYLQQKRIIPAMLTLQKDCEPNFVNHWNMAFARIPHRGTNTESVYALLGGFFQFYRKLDFSAVVLAPYTGTSIDRRQFDAGNAPEEYSLYAANVKNELCKPLVLNSVMCVQDPMDHSRNVAVAVFPKLFIRIVGLFDRAATMFESENSNDFLKRLLHVEQPSIFRVPEPPVPRGSKNRGVSKRNSKRNARSIKRQIDHYNRLQLQHRNGATRLWN